MIGRWLLVLGALNGAAVVALGAYGAHAVSDPAAMARFQSAIHYHMFHTLGILVIGALAMTRERVRLLAAAGIAMFLGIVLFCGSLYVAAAGYRGPTGLAPIGGTSFIVGWILFAVGVWRR